jgi:competence protein ComEC
MRGALIPFKLRTCKNAQPEVSQIKKTALLSIGILFILFMLLLASVTGCQKQIAPASPPPTPTSPAPTQTKGELKVHFIDVGQGDSILIDLGETEVLIDGGEKSPGVVSYLDKYVDGPLEVMVATHPHADHIGGLIAVLDTFQVEQIWHNGDTSTSKTYTEFMSAVHSEGAPVHTGRRGDKISAGELSFTILNPSTLAGTTNNNSIVASLSYGNVDFLFTGDAEQEAEAAMLAASDIPVPEVEILKVGHHGSRTASSKDFLAVTSPEVAVYMAGKGNSYGHPHQETLDALDQIGAKIYGTDVNGTIIVTTDGAAYTIQTTK